MYFVYIFQIKSVMYYYGDRQSQDGSVNMGSVSDITESQSAFEMRPWPAHYSSQASITPSYKSFMSAYTPSQASFFVLPVTSEVPDQLRKPEDNWGFAFCSLLINPIFGVVAILLAGMIFFSIMCCNFAMSEEMGALQRFPYLTLSSVGNFM